MEKFHSDNNTDDLLLMDKFDQWEAESPPPKPLPSSILDEHEQYKKKYHF